MLRQLNPPPSLALCRGVINMAVDWNLYLASTGAMVDSALPISAL